MSVRAVPSVETELLDELTALARACSELQALVALLAHEVRVRLQVTERALARADGVGAQIAAESTRALQELVEDLLELARARSDARASAGEAMRLVLQDFGDDVETEIVVGELPTVGLPLALLRTVLRNLVANAVEAGASRVEVLARPDGAICVRDDGPGVTPAAAARLFGAYSSKFGGAGLALSLSRQILRQRGGELWLEPPSSFWFRAR